MKKIFRFMLVEFYVLAVLAVTTVEAKGYVERKEEKAEELQDADNIMAVSVELTVSNDENAGEESNGDDVLNSNEESNGNDVLNSNEESNGDDVLNNNEGLNGGDVPDSNEESNDDDRLNNNEEPDGDEELNSNEESDSNEASDDDINDSTYFDFFNKWKNVCELFVGEFDKVNGPIGSYETTMRMNQLDKKRISENKYDFSQLKIACLGDSVTAASNLEDEENYEQYAYPSVLKELLNAEEVYNLGIGGSSIGRYWFEPFVERYMEIPEDTDIIIVMGGYNDGFSATEEEFGSLDEREASTFCGDLDELMRGLKEHYPNAVVFFVAPPANSLHGFLMGQREKLIPQEEYALVIEMLSKEYGFEFIDLYHTGFLDTYDENIVEEFVPDTTHGNHEGYRILAERFAGEIVEYYNKRAGIESDAKTEDDIKIESDTQTDGDNEPESDIETDGDNEPESDNDTENDADTEGGLDLESGIDSEKDAEAESDT